MCPCENHIDQMGFIWSYMHQNYFKSILFSWCLLDISYDVSYEIQFNSQSNKENFKSNNDDKKEITIPDD